MIVSLILGTIPLWTIVFAFFVLGDKITCFDISCLLVSFAGMAIMISGTYKQDVQNGEESVHAQGTLIIAFILLVLCTLAAGYGSVV